MTTQPNIHPLCFPILLLLHYIPGAISSCSVCTRSHPFEAGGRRKKSVLGRPLGQKVRARDNNRDCRGRESIGGGRRRCNWVKRTNSFSCKRHLHGVNKTSQSEYHPSICVSTHLEANSNYIRSHSGGAKIDLIFGTRCIVKLCRSGQIFNAKKKIWWNLFGSHIRTPTSQLPTDIVLRAIE